MVLFFLCFCNLQFRIILAFPVIRIEDQTSNNTPLMIHLTVSKSFYNLQYPFHFPDTFYASDLNIACSTIGPTVDPTEKVTDIRNHI